MLQWSGYDWMHLEDMAQKIDTSAGLQEEVRKSDEGFKGVDKKIQSKGPTT